MKSKRVDMSERLVEIPVERQLRTVLKDVKGDLTYSEFLKRLLDQNGCNYA